MANKELKNIEIASWFQRTRNNIIHITPLKWKKSLNILSGTNTLIIIMNLQAYRYYIVTGMLK
jgi:hypothetical protein